MSAAHSSDSSPQLFGIFGGRSKPLVAAMAVVSLVSLVAGYASAQEKEQDTRASVHGPVFESNVREVSVVFRVVDKKGQTVPDITAKDIKIEDEGAVRNITSFSADVAHAQVVVLADVSGSMSTVLEPLAGALFTFADLVSKDVDRQPGDVQLSLLPFSDTATLLVDRTSDPEEFKEAVTRLRPGGATALVDTILAALRVAFAQKETPLPRRIAGGGGGGGALSPIPSEFRPRRAANLAFSGAKRSKFLVIFTDAGENASSHRWADIASQMLGRGVVMYSVAFDSGTPDSNLPMLSNVTHESGGKVYRARAGDLQRVYSQIAREIRSYYALTFAASDVENPRRWRQIRVTTSRPGATIFARNGYCPEAPCQKPDGAFVGGAPKNWNQVVAISRDPVLIFSLKQHLSDLRFDYSAETEQIVRQLAGGPLLIEKTWTTDRHHSVLANKPLFLVHQAGGGNQSVNIDAEVCGVSLEREPGSAPDANVSTESFRKSGVEPTLRVLDPEIRLSRRPGSTKTDGSEQDSYFQSQAVFILQDQSGRIPSRLRVQCNRPNFLVSQDLVRFAVQALEQGLKVRVQNPVKEP